MAVADGAIARGADVNDWRKLFKAADKVKGRGPVPADDPMFTGRYEIFSSKNSKGTEPAGPKPLLAEDNQIVNIHSANYWVKVVDFLKQNWALIDEEADGRARVFFINDTSGIFDELVFKSANHAREALMANRFRELSESPDLHSLLHPPLAPFHRTSHPNGPIYSSGRFWK